MKKQRALRLKAWLLTLCMVISLVPTTAFAAAGNTLKYVSLGDSMSNGYGLANYNENTSGYQGYGVGAYPNVFYQNYLKSAGYTTHEQLAMSAMRAEDLHFLLKFPVNNANALAIANGTTFNEATWKATFGAGDKYTWQTFTKDGGRIERNGLDTKTVAKAYQDAVKGADLISLGIGNANFGVFLMENITKAFGLFGEKSSTDWMDTALNGCDDAVAAKLNELVAQIKPKLSSGLSALGEAADPVVDAILYTTVSYLVNYAGVLDSIVKLNGDAEVIIVGIMNTTEGMTVSFEVNGKDQTLKLSDVLGLLVEPINAYMTALPALLQAKGDYPNATFYYAEAPSVQCLVETFGDAIFKDDNVVRNRFFETIVGTESNPGFIWGIADEMLGEMALVDGMTVELTYITLEDVEAYEVALKAAVDGNVDALQKDYINPVLKFATAETDEEKAAAQAAIDKLLSLAFYVSLEATVLEASEPAYGKLNAAALAALANGNFTSAFEPVMGAIEDPIDDILDATSVKKINDAVYKMIADIATDLIGSEAGNILDSAELPGGIEINTDISVTITSAMVEGLLSDKQAEVDAVIYELIAEMANDMLTLEGDKALTKADVENIYKINDTTDPATDPGYAKLYKLAAEMVQGMEVSVGEGDDAIPIKVKELNITADDIKAIYSAPESDEAYEVYYALAAAAAGKMDESFKDVTAEDVKSIVDDDPSLTDNIFDLAIKMAANETIYEDLTLGDLTIDGKPLEGKHLKAMYEFAMAEEGDADYTTKQAAAYKVYYALMAAVAEDMGYEGLEANDFKTIIETDELPENIFKVGATKANEMSVTVGEGADAVTIVLGNLMIGDNTDPGLTAADVKALYDFAKAEESDADYATKQDAAYEIYFAVMAAAADGLGYEGLDVDAIESIIEYGKPTAKVFEIAIEDVLAMEIKKEDLAGVDGFENFDGLKLSELLVNGKQLSATDLEALYWFAKNGDGATNKQKTTAYEVYYALVAMAAKDKIKELFGNEAVLSADDIQEIYESEMPNGTMYALIAGLDEAKEYGVSVDDIKAIYEFAVADASDERYEEKMNAAYAVYYREVIEEIEKKVMDEKGVDVSGILKAEDIADMARLGKPVDNLFKLIACLDEAKDNGLAWDDIKVIYAFATADMSELSYEAKKTAAYDVYYQVILEKLQDPNNDFGLDNVTDDDFTRADFDKLLADNGGEPVGLFFKEAANELNKKLFGEEENAIPTDGSQMLKEDVEAIYTFAKYGAGKDAAYKAYYKLVQAKADEFNGDGADEIVIDEESLPYEDFKKLVYGATGEPVDLFFKEAANKLNDELFTVVPANGSQMTKDDIKAIYYGTDAAAIQNAYYKLVKAKISDFGIESLTRDDFNKLVAGQPAEVIFEEATDELNEELFGATVPTDGTQMLPSDVKAIYTYAMDGTGKDAAYDAYYKLVMAKIGEFDINSLSRADFDKLVAGQPAEVIFEEATDKLNEELFGATVPTDGTQMLPSDVKAIYTYAMGDDTAEAAAYDAYYKLVLAKISDFGIDSLSRADFDKLVAGQPAEVIFEEAAEEMNDELYGTQAVSADKKIISADIKAIYDFAKGDATAKTAAYAAYYKMVAAKAGEVADIEGLTPADVKALYENGMPVDALLKKAADEVNSEENLTGVYALTFEDLKAIYNGDAAAYNAYFKLVASESADPILTPNEVATIYGGTPISKLFTEAEDADAVKEYDLTGTDLEAIYWYAKGDNTYEAAAKAAYYKVAAQKVEGLEDYDIKNMVEDGRPTYNVFNKAVTSDQVKDYNLLATDLQAIYWYVNGNATEKAFYEETAQSAYYKIAAEEVEGLNAADIESIVVIPEGETKAQPTMNVFVKMADNNANKDEDGEDILTPAQIQGLYIGGAAADAVYYELAAEAVSERYQVTISAAEVGALVDADASNDAEGYDALYNIAAAMLGKTVIELKEYEEEHPVDVATAIAAARADINNQFASVKANEGAQGQQAINNVLGDVAGEFNDAVAQINAELTDAINEAMDEAEDKLAEAIPEINGKLTEEITKVLDDFKTDLDKAVVGDSEGETQEEKDGLRKTIKDGIDEAISEFKDSFDKAVAGDTTKDPVTDKEAYEGLQKTIKDTIDDAVEEFRDTFDDAVFSEVEGDEGVNKSVKDGVNDAVTDFQTEFNKAVFSEVEGDEGVNKSVKDGVNEAVEKFQTEYEKAINGDPEGTSDVEKDGVDRTVKEGIDEAVNKFRTTFTETVFGKPAQGNEPAEVGANNELVDELDKAVADFREVFTETVFGTPSKEGLNQQLVDNIDEVVTTIGDAFNDDPSDPNHKTIHEEMLELLAEPITDAINTIVDGVNTTRDKVGETVLKEVDAKIDEVRDLFTETVYGVWIEEGHKDNKEGVNTRILNTIDENINNVRDQFYETIYGVWIEEGHKDNKEGVNSIIVTKVNEKTDWVAEQFNNAQPSIVDAVASGVNSAQNVVATAVGTARETIAEYDLNTYFDLLCKFIALDDVMPTAAAKSPELMSLLHLFARMLVGNGLGAHPSATGHGDLAEAVEKAFVEKHTVQKELAKDSVLVLGGMAALLTKFGADILGIAFDTETIKNYLNNPREAVRDLAETMDQRFKDYESSKATLEGAIASLERKLDALVGRMEMLSELLADKQQELSDALYQVADKTDMAADTAVKNLTAIVDDLAAAIDMTRKTIETVQAALDEAKAQLNALETSMRELKAAVETLKKGADDMDDLFTKFNGAVDALVVAYQTATDTMLKGISAVKTAYQKTEAASQQAKAYATKATTAASKAYDEAYKALSDLYDAMPADMALVLFGAAGGGAFVALTLTKDHLVPYAEARIAEKQAELDAEVLKLEAEIAEKTEYMNSLADNAAEKGKVKAEIDSMQAQILKLKNETAGEIAELRRGIDEAHAGNLTMLKADYQKLVESVTSGVRPAIKQAMDDLAASAVKTVCQRITTTITAISKTIGIIDEKIDRVVNDSKNSYTMATHDDYLITDDSYYVALGDSVAAAERSYVDLLSVAKTATKKHDIPFNNLAVANQSVTEAVSYVKSNAAEIAKADLITVGYGHTTFANLALDRAMAAMKGESVADLNWSKYIGDAGAAYVASNLAEIEASLVAAGVNEKAENSNAAKAAVMAVEAYAYAAVEYLCTLPSVIAAIREINPSAVLVIVGMHNPMADLELTHESADGAKTTIQLGAYLGKLVDGVDVYGTLYAMLVSRTAKAIFVDTPVVDVDPVNDEDNKISADAFLLKVKSGGINPYPTADGQADIKDYILNALTITDSANTPIDGEVTIEGEAVYGRAVTALYEGNAEGFVTYQWYRDGVAIANATSSEYKVTAADVGHNITVTVTGTGDYKNSFTSGALTVEKAPYPNAEHPVVTAYYGYILDEVTLKNDNWAWTNDNFFEDVGAAGSEAEWEAVYTPTVAEATVDGFVVYKEAVVMVTVKVEKATIPTMDIVAPKALADLTYTGQTQTLIEAGSVKNIASANVVMQYALGNAEGPTEEWSVTLPTATDAATYYVWYRVEGGNNYVTTQPQCISATINALLTYAVTYSANGGIGTMAAGTATQDVPFALPACGFTAPAGKMFKGWSYEANGAIITDSKISVTSGITLYAIWEDIFEEAPEAENFTYDGTEKPLITPEQPKDGTTIKYTTGTKDAPTGEWSENIPTGKDAGTYYVWYEVLDGEGNVIHMVWIEVIIYEAAPEYTAPEAENGMIWNGEARPLVSPVGTVTGGKMQYALGTKDAPTGEWSENIPTGKDAGTYYVWYQIIGDENHKDILLIDHILVEIGKAPATVNAPKANTNLQYNGSVQDLIANVGGVDGGKLQYAFGTDATTQPGDSAWQDNLDSAKMNAGTYHIWYRIVCDNNHEYAGDTIVCVTVTVVKAPLTVTTKDQIIYYGDEIKYLIPEIDGFVNDVDKANLEKLLLSALGSYTYAPGESGGAEDEFIPEIAPTSYRLRNAARAPFVPKDVGTYDISLSGDLTAYPALGNYEVTVNSGKLTILPKSLNVEWDTATFTYDGTAKNLPAATATNTVFGDKLGLTVELVGAAEAKDAGTYTAKVTGITGDKASNYKLPGEAITTTFTIAPKQVNAPVVELNGKNFTYTGSAIEPDVTLKDDEGNVIPADQYTVTYSDNVEAGTATVTIKPVANGNYSFDDITTTFTITKINITAPAAVTGLTYNGEAQTLIVPGSVDGGKILYSLNGEDFSETVPTGTNAGNYTVYYKVVVDGLNAEPAVITATIAKATPACQTPSNLVATYGDTLADVTLPAGWVWETDTQSVGNVGENTFKASFTPADTANYDWTKVEGWNAAAGRVERMATVTVVKAEATVKTAPAAKAGLQYTGAAQQLITAGTAVGGTMMYSLDGETFSIAIPEATNAGTYTVWYYVAGDGNYGDTVPASVTVTIGKKTAQITADPTAKDLTYTGVAQQLVTDGTAVGGEMMYSLDGMTYYEGIPEATEAGTYTVKYYVAGDANHSISAIESVTVTIGKAALTVTANNKTITYGDAPANSGVTFSGFVNNETESVLVGTLRYSYGYTQNGNVGTYTITPAGLTSDNYDITFVDGALVVEAKQVSKPVIELSGYNFTYTGSAIEPTVKIYDGKVEIPASEYTVTYRDNVNVGQATVTITDKDGGNYVVSGGATFSINGPDAAQITSEPTAVSGLVYTGAAQDLVNAGAVTNGTLYYALGDYDAAPTDGWSTELPEATEAGTYNVWYYAEGDVKYTDTAPVRVTVTIAKAESSVINAPAAQKLTYTGEEQQLVTAGTAVGGTMMYSTDGKTFSKEIPTATEAGTYMVWYKVAGDANHNDTVVDGPIKVTIDEKAADTFTVSGTVTSFLDDQGTVTIELCVGNEVKYTTTTIGNDAQYTLTDVAAGTYTMKVSKANHVTREYTVTATDGTVTQDVKIHLLGDINGDGKVDTRDVSRANAHAQKRTLLSEYAFACADITGDGKVDTRDVSRANAHAQKRTMLW